MKCIQAVKETKYAKVGDIKRVTEQEADEKVSTKYWKFVSKSQWKSKQLTQSSEEQAVEAQKPEIKLKKISNHVSSRFS